MQRILAVLTAIVGLTLAFLSYERLFLERTLGPAAIAALAGLSLLFSMLLTTVVLHNTRHRRTIANIWLVIFSIAIAYFAVDLAAGYLLIKPLSPPLVPDPYVHHRLVPNSNAQFTQQDFSYVQRVNNLGLRGADQPIAKPPNTIRVVMLGDSFTMGKGVEDSETFSVGVQRILNERLAACGSVLRAEVLNAGVDSYAPILSYIQFTRDIAPLRPDLVIHNLDVSDLVQEAAYRRIAKFSATGEPLAVPQREQRHRTLNERARNWVEQHHYLTRLLLYFVNRLFGYKDVSLRAVVTQATFETAAHTLVGDTVDRSEQWAGLFDSIRRLRSAATGAGADYVLTVYPWGHQVNDREWVPGRFSFVPSDAKVSDASTRRLESFAVSDDIVLLNLFPLFRAYSGSLPLYFSYDNHLTPQGHRWMAKGIAGFLTQRYEASWCGHPAEVS